MDTNEAQTVTLDGRYRFVETLKAQYIPGKPYREEHTGMSDCNGCALPGSLEVAPPCSPGARRDGKSGIWVTVK